MTVPEGSLYFNFPVGWIAIKYDDTDFYRSVIETTGAELSAVDIIASPALPDHRLIMIEVKDFRGHAPENQKRQTSGELIREIIRNGLHSIAGLYTGVNAHAAAFSAFHAIITSVPYDIELILFMEEDPIPANRPLELQNHKNKIDLMELKMKGKLKKLKIKGRVLNTALMKAREGWTVQ